MLLDRVDPYAKSQLLHFRSFSGRQVHDSPVCQLHSGDAGVHFMCVRCVSDFCTVSDTIKEHEKKHACHFATPRGKPPMAHSPVHHVIQPEDFCHTQNMHSGKDASMLCANNRIHQKRNATFDKNTCWCTTAHKKLCIIPAYQRFSSQRLPRIILLRIC